MEGALMNRSRLALGLIATAGALTLAGCLYRKEASELHYVGHADLNYYKDVATSIDFPNVEDNRPDEVTASVEPHTLFDRRHDAIWDVTLGEVIQLGLANNRIIRVATQFLAPTNGLML